VLGVLTALAGAGIALLGGVNRPPNAATVRAGVREVSLADQFALATSAWPYVYAAAGLLVLAGGVLVTTTAGRWPQRADRFSRTSAAAEVTAEDDPGVVWRAQDAGLDPTTEPGTPSTVTPGADVLSEPIRDTMGHEPQRRSSE
jgi:hypothetical protein